MVTLMAIRLAGKYELLLGGTYLGTVAIDLVGIFCTFEILRRLISC